jgi:hypothetical protein
MEDNGRGSQESSLDVTIAYRWDVVGVAVGEIILGDSARVELVSNEVRGESFSPYRSFLTQPKRTTKATVPISHNPTSITARGTGPLPRKWLTTNRFRGNIVLPHFDSNRVSPYHDSLSCAFTVQTRLHLKLFPKGTRPLYRAINFSKSEFRVGLVLHTVCGRRGFSSPLQHWIQQAMTRQVFDSLRVVRLYNDLVARGNKLAGSI